MAKASDLMGLGVPPFVAHRLANDPQLVTAIGTTQPTAYQLGTTGMVAVMSTNSGNYANLPNVGGSPGVLVGDRVIIANLTAGSIVVTASSGVTINIHGAATTGTTGVSVSTISTSIFWPVSPTTWIGLQSA